MNVPVLLIYQPDGTVQDLPLTSDCLTLGRAEDCDIVVEGRLISRRHARICKTGQGYSIEDLGSHNGTTVNGQRITRPHNLHDGDRIALGGVGRLTFSDSDSTSTLPQPSVVGVWLDSPTQDVWVDGQCLVPRLSPAQFKLLQTLSICHNQICSRTDIIAAVWPNISEGVSDEALDALIKRVRARLNEIPGGENYLVTLRGRGLMLRAASD